jgi:hypothetical protein
VCLDSTSEEQPRPYARCDLDHFISLNRLPSILTVDKFPERAHNSVHTERLPGACVFIDSEMVFGTPETELKQETELKALPA